MNVEVRSCTISQYNVCHSIITQQYHPFELKGDTGTSSNSKTSLVSATQVLVDFNAGYDTRPVEMRFPVSAGIDHQVNDTEQEPATNNTTVRYN